jgi:molybdopterin-guanine dinucleotide biosynthesis protein A
MKPVSGFVLAGGKSARIGRDKALLEWHGQTLLEHVTALLSKAADNVQVIGRGALPDRIPGRGPLSGIATALEITSTELNLVVAVDLPLLTEEFIKYFRSRLEISSRPLLACKIGSHFPLCLGIARTLLPEVQRRLTAEDLSIHALIEDCDADILSAGFAASMFRNINTEEDYRAALKQI